MITLCCLVKMVSFTEFCIIVVNIKLHILTDQVG